MSKDEKYTSIEIDTEAMTDGQKLAIAVIMNEGRLREREQNVAILQELFETAENAETRRLLTMAIARINGEVEETETDA